MPPFMFGFPGSLGASLFGPENGPNPVIDEQPNPYEGQVNEYLATLQQPIQLPELPPVPQGTALAMVMDPQRYGQMMEQHRQPYEREIAQLQMNLNQRGRAGDLAARLSQQHEQRQERAWEKKHVWEQSAANAGNVNYPYQIPGMRDQARSVDTARRSLTGQRNRSNLGIGSQTGVRPKFPTRAHHVAWLEQRLSSRQSQLSKMYEAAAMPGWDRNPNGQNVLGDMEEDYSTLRSQREAIAKMNEDQYRRFSQLSEQEQDAVMGAMRGEAPAGENPLPEPWVGQAPGAPAPKPPPWK